MKKITNKFYRLHKALIFHLIFAIFAFSSCSEYKETEIAEIKILSGDNQALPPNSVGKEIVCELLGPKRPGLLGGTGNQYPVANAKFRLQPLHDSDIEILDWSEKSDAGGKIKFSFKTKAQLGDNYIKIIPEGFESAAKTVRIINGVKIYGANQEAFSDNFLDEPVKVQVFNPDGSPAEGVNVYFSFISFPGEKNTAKCKQQIITDKDGIAENQIKLGKGTGKYKLLIEICRPPKLVGVINRGIEITLYGKNFFGITGLFITVLGGLAIFIFGMSSMSEGLQIVAGEQMKKILRFFTKNRLIAILAGTLVTGIIQSSSATTVMVVGFVNAGLLDTLQSIGVIFGANIGTTVTAQLISFKIGDITYLFLIAGLIVYLLSEKSRTKGWGQSMLGFGLLFLGLEIMSSQLKTVSEFPSVVNIFKLFDCTPAANGSFMPLSAVLGAILVGTIMTVIIQSSSATIGIAIVLAANNLINFYTAVPLILGDNIGTTITANLAAIGANKKAKQVAFAHFLFNLIGVLWILFFLFIPWEGNPSFLTFINYITPGDVFAVEPINITRHIAMAHTMFNVCNVIVLFPFIPLLDRICSAVIKIKDDSSVKIKYLEPHLLDTPPVAIEQAIASIRYMTSEAWKMTSEIMHKIIKEEKITRELSDECNSKMIKIYELQNNLTKYLVELTSRRLTEPQAEIIPLLIHCTNDAYRIAKQTETLMDMAEKINKSELKISSSIREELEYLWQQLSEQARFTLDYLMNTESLNYKISIYEENKIYESLKHLEKKNAKMMKKGKTDASSGTLIFEILSVIEKIGDHLNSIAEKTPEIQKEHIRL